MTYLNLLFILGWVVISCTALVGTFWATFKFEDWVNNKIPSDAVVPLCLLVWLLQVVIIGSHIAWEINRLDSLWFPVLP